MSLAFFLDVDNTLIDNDRVKADLDERIDGLLGRERAARFWEAYEAVRRERDYVDFPHTLARFRAAFPQEAAFPQLANLVLCYPYAESLYPGTLDAVRHLRALGRVAIVSDGDPVFQPAKIARAGLAEAVSGEVVVTVHKEERLAEIARRYPADRYVLVDDKPRILAAAKERLGEPLLTLHVCQGRYAHAAEHEDHAPADREIDGIADLLALGREDFFARGTRRS